MQFDAYGCLPKPQLVARVTWVQDGSVDFFYSTFRNVVVHQLYSEVVIQFFKLLRPYPRVFHIYLHKAATHKQMF